jgi:hypothetical protein
MAAIAERAQLDPNRLPRAATYVRGGAVSDLTLEPGLVTARVAGRDDQQYDVRIRVRTFGEREWEQVLEALSEQAAHAAALLAGQLSAEVAERLGQAGLSLLPRPGEIGPRCTCPDEADPCKHAAAVCLLVAGALDDDPSVVLLLRGRGTAEVLAGIRSRRRLSADRPVPGPGPGSAPAPGSCSSSSEPGRPAPGGGPGSEPAPTARPSADPAPAPADPGLDAREILSNRDRPPIPPPPQPPRRPGRPAAWPFDPPGHLAGLRSELVALAADAAQRAWELAVGASPDAGLALDADADLARRAERVLGTPAFARLAVTSGVAERELARWALAWRHGRATGFSTLRGRWNPASDGEADVGHLIAPGRAALRDATGAQPVARGDRVTSGDRQLRLGQDYRWYPYRRLRGHWEPAGTPSADPAFAVARAWPVP